MKNYLIKLNELFKAHAHSEIAAKQKKYLQNQFSFFGIQQPTRKKLEHQAKQHLALKSNEELKELILTLWDLDEREYQYTALDLLTTYKRLCDESFLPFFEHLIRTKSWWDTVDMLSGTHIGRLLIHNETMQRAIDPWIDDPNLWIRRAALIFQLKFKERTNKEILARNIIQTMHEKDFFIQKAIGWALRELSKTDPLWVKDFIKRHEQELSALSKREGSAYL